MIPPRPPYHPSSVYVDNLRFGSQLEADRYCELKQEMQAGKLWFLRQVAFPIAPGTAYRCSFLVVTRRSDRDEIHLEDAHGEDNPVTNANRDQVRKIFDIHVIVLKREDVPSIVTESGTYPP